LTSIIKHLREGEGQSTRRARIRSEFALTNRKLTFLLSLYLRFAPTRIRARTERDKSATRCEKRYSRNVDADPVAGHARRSRADALTRSKVPFSLIEASVDCEKQERVDVESRSIVSGSQEKKEPPNESKVFNLTQSVTTTRSRLLLKILSVAHTRSTRWRGFNDPPPPPSPQNMK